MFSCLLSKSRNTPRKWGFNELVGRLFCRFSPGPGLVCRPSSARWAAVTAWWRGWCSACRQVCNRVADVPLRTNQTLGRSAETRAVSVSQRAATVCRMSTSGQTWTLCRTVTPALTSHCTSRVSRPLAGQLPGGAESQRPPSRRRAPAQRSRENPQGESS